MSPNSLKVAFSAFSKVMLILGYDLLIRTVACILFWPSMWRLGFPIFFIISHTFCAWCAKTFRKWEALDRTEFEYKY